MALTNDPAVFRPIRRSPLSLAPPYIKSCRVQIWGSIGSHRISLLFPSPRMSVALERALGSNASALGNRERMPVTSLPAQRYSFWQHHQADQREQNAFSFGPHALRGIHYVGNAFIGSVVQLNISPLLPCAWSILTPLSCRFLTSITLPVTVATSVLASLPSC